MTRILKEGATAVVTGAARGVGLAACIRFAERGMNVVMVDLDEDAVKAAREEHPRALGDENDGILEAPADVANYAHVLTVLHAANDRFGQVDVLFAGAGTRIGGGPFDFEADWREAFRVNYQGVENCIRAFGSELLRRRGAGALIVAGSKQGITNAPGNLAYNVTKAAVKTFMEGVSHTLRSDERGTDISAHLLLPGWTSANASDRSAGAWSPMQVADRMVEGVEAGDFYILCHDGEVSAELDRARMHWATGDITENRPALSRWHPDWWDEAPS